MTTAQSRNGDTDGAVDVVAQEVCGSILFEAAELAGTDHDAWMVADSTMTMEECR